MMKIVINAFLLSISFNLYAGMVSSMPSTFTDTGIPNNHQLSPNIVRGMAPRNDKDLNKLIDLGFEKFLLFKIDTNGDISKEINKLIELGIDQSNILHLPFPWKDITDYQSVCEMTIDALNMIKKADEKNQRLYFHCTVGEDRTGYLAGLYRIYRGDGLTVNEIFEEELCDKGYEAGNPKKIYSVVQKVRESLTPAFIGMVKLIENNPGKMLTKNMCNDLNIKKTNLKEFICKKSKLIN